MSAIAKKINTAIMCVDEVAHFLHKSPSWVYKNWQELGGVKLGGSLFFPSKEELYERLFKEKQGVEIRLHPTGDQVHKSLVQNQEGGRQGRKQKAGGGVIRKNTGSNESDGKAARNDRHNLFGND